MKDISAPEKDGSCRDDHEKVAHDSNKMWDVEINQANPDKVYLLNGLNKVDITVPPIFILFIKSTTALHRGRENKPNGKLSCF